MFIIETHNRSDQQIGRVNIPFVKPCTPDAVTVHVYPLESALPRERAHSENAPVAIECTIGEYNDDHDFGKARMQELSKQSADASGNCKPEEERIHGVARSG